MRLLVSVRSAEEARSAVAGGADVVDAKEPGRGALGPVAASVLVEIARAVPDRLPLSVALGDFTSAADASHAVSAVRVPARSLPVYLKLGFAGVADPEAIGAILSAAVAAAEIKTPEMKIVAVAYADYEPAGTMAPTAVATIAARHGASGVLVDTCSKDGRDLLHWLPRPDLDAWIDEARQSALMVALAGSLRGARIAGLSDARADLLGVRGAACEGGRDGMVSAHLVRATRLAMVESADRGFARMS